MSAKRSRVEWEQLVAELEASGEPVGRFAAARGVNRNTLAWWRWRTRSTPASEPLVDFLPVVVEPDFDTSEAHDPAGERLNPDLSPIQPLIA